MTHYKEVNPALLVTGARGLGLMASPLHDTCALKAYSSRKSETFLDQNGDDILIPSLVIWSSVPQTATGLAECDLEKEEVIKPPVVRVEYANGVQPTTWWRNASSNSIDSLILQRRLSDQHETCGPLYHRERWTSNDPWRCTTGNPLCEEYRGFMRDSWIVPAHIVAPVHGAVGQEINALLNADHMTDLTIGATTEPETLWGGDCPCPEPEHLKECEVISEAGHCACCAVGKGYDILQDVISGFWHPTETWPGPLERHWQRLVENNRRGWDRWRGASNEGQALDWPIWYDQRLFTATCSLSSTQEQADERRKAWRLSSPSWLLL